ncbi:alpha/beta hydrolase [Streptomyces indicus]|uniref:alpha/beta hydrolase n=1 Tax=Streptomyces indicus TaxID=417292 RepID=UPI001FEBAFDD|nr:alpha/beta hydrolase [Streptomyces indicus]
MVLTTAASLVLALMAPASAPARAAADQPDLTRFYAQRIAWEDCAAEMADEARRTWASSEEKLPAAMARAECGDIDVPRDYAAPSGPAGTAKIAMLRIGAADAKRRIGSLVLNFGGPGLSGRLALNSHLPELARLNERFDLVAPDPRGVGNSDPVFCRPPDEPPDEPSDAPADAPADHDQTPDTADEARRVADAQRRYNARCDEARDVLPWVGTTNAARDLDVLRAALGDDKLHYLGFSYGTKLGANYLHQFPGRAGKFVLDGVDDPTVDTRGAALANTRAFQLALDDFLADCVRQGPKECPLGASAAAARRTVEDRFKALDGTSVRAGEGRLDQGTFTEAVQASLYSRTKGWPPLRAALADLVVRGDGTALAALGGQTFTGTSRPDTAGTSPPDTRPVTPGLPPAVPGVLPAVPGLPLTAPGTLPAAPGDREQQESDALRAVSCRDTAERPTPADFLAAVDEFTEASPVFGRRTAAAMLQCTGWPVPGDDSAREVAAEDAPPALLVGTRGDPATPYENTAHMADALGNDSRILTYEGEGHGAYVTPSTCVHEHVERYLTEGRLPDEGTTCR